MPTFDWQCGKVAEHVFEEWVPKADVREMPCKICTGELLDVTNPNVDTAAQRALINGTVGIAKRMIAAPATNFRCADGKPNKTHGKPRYYRTGSL